MEDKKAYAEKEFRFWAGEYWEHRNPADLLAVGQYWGQLTILYDGAVPEELENYMEIIVESLGK